MDRVSRGIKFIKDNQFLILGFLLAVSLMIFGALVGTPIGYNALGGGNSLGGVIYHAFSYNWSRILFGIAVFTSGLGYIVSVFKFKRLRLFFSGMMTCSFIYIVLLRMIVVGITPFTGFFIILIVVSFMVYVNMSESDWQ